MSTIKASAKGGGKSKRQLEHIHIRRAGNGFMVHKEYAPERDSDGMRLPQPSEAPAVFTKHSQAKKHVAAAMAEMHPPNPGDADGGAAGVGGSDLDAEQDAAPVATNP